jgi:glyoxylase-like metal-dependent hydrolase (beta-lactamase superfamily II)
MTGRGTNSYLIGDQQLSLLDPGPRDDIQCDNFLAAINGRELKYILVTHTHGDHSPGAQRLQEATGAELVGLPAPLDGNHDREFKPNKNWQHDDVIRLDDYSIRLVHTPGHVSNHLCYLLEQEQMLFTGDHVLEGTTSVILPPDGDMSHYLESLSNIAKLGLRYLAPGHGALMEQPNLEIEKLIAHRLKREQKVLAGVDKLVSSNVDQLVLVVYDDVAEHLIPWAKKTMLAHLIKLQRDGLLINKGDNWLRS